ncbi:MAG TPA: hypothetical protein VNZ47_02530 [Candidatus Dormibacteraeota bacterium]|nr:hypothetical protein [Candidatus Dormibacteraeota bacterium]
MCHTDAATVAGVYPGLTLSLVPGHEVVGTASDAIRHRTSVLGILRVDGLTSCQLVDVIGLPLSTHGIPCTPLNPPHCKNLQHYCIARIFGPMLAYIGDGNGKDSVSRLKRPDGVRKQSETPRPE